MVGVLRQEVVVVVARRGSFVYKQKQEFDDRITMFRLEIYIYILKNNCRMFTKTVIQNNGTCIYARGKTAA